MFTYDPDLTHVAADEAEILELYRSSEMLELHREGFPNPPCEAFIAVHAREGMVDVYVALYTRSPLHTYLFRAAESVDRIKGYRSLLKEALAFLDDLGFQMESLSLSYTKAMREVVIKAIPFIQLPGMSLKPARKAVKGGRHDDEHIFGGGLSREEARISQEEVSRRQLEAEIRSKIEHEARQKIEAETRQKVEAEARQKIEVEVRRKFEEEVKVRAEEEAKRRAEEEAKRRAEEEAKRRAEEEAKRRAEEEAKRRAEEEAKRRAEEEAKRRAEEEAKRWAEEEAKRRAEEEAKRRAEEEAKRKAERPKGKIKSRPKTKPSAEVDAEWEDEIRRRIEEEIRSRIEEEVQRRIEEEVQRRIADATREMTLAGTQQTEQDRLEAEAKRKAEADAKRRAEEEAKRKAEDARRSPEEWARLAAEREERQSRSMALVDDAASRLLGRQAGTTEAGGDNVNRPSGMPARLFRLAPELESIVYRDPAEVVGLYVTLTMVQLAPEDFPQQHCSAYVCSMLMGRECQIYVALRLRESRRTLVYVPRQQPANMEEYRNLLQAAVQFLEVVGFLVEPVDLNLPAPAKLATLKNIPVLSLLER